MEVAKISVAVGADTGQFTQGMQTVDQRLKNIQGGLNKFGDTMIRRFTLPMIAAAGAIGGLIIKAGQWADELLDLSAATGISVENLQRYRFAAVDAGTETDIFADAVMYMNRQILDNADFSTRLTTITRDLGIATHDAAGEMRNAEDVAWDLVLALSDIEDEAERAAIGSQAFSRQWEELAPIVALGREELEKISGIDVFSREQLEQLDDARLAWDRLKNEIFLAGVEVALALTDNQDLADLMENTVKPAIENVTEKVKDLITWWRDLDDEHQELIKTVGLVLIAIGPASKLAAALIGIGRFVGIIIQGLMTLTGTGAGSFAAGSAAAGTAAGGGFLLLSVKLALILGTVMSLIGAFERLDRWTSKGFDMDKPSDQAWHERFFGGESNWSTGGFMSQFHAGGTFRAPRLGGEGMAMLKDGERVLPAGVQTGEGPATNITMTITQHITDKTTADYAIDKLGRVFQSRGLVGAYR